MRTTITPAQVTTIEDKITGNISVSQLFLFITPVLSASIIFILFPPFFDYAQYKVFIIACLVSVCCILAIRLRDKILLVWIVSILRYNLRPRYYVLDKNHIHGRRISPQENLLGIVNSQTGLSSRPQPLPILNMTDLVRIEQIITDPERNVRFTTNRRGELHVHITEIKT